MPPTKPIVFADVAERYGIERPHGDADPCPQCGEPYGACKGVHELAEAAKKAAGARKAAARRVTPAAHEEHGEDLERLVMVTEEVWEDRLPNPWSKTPVTLLKYARFQRIPLREALENGVQWIEVSDPEPFGLELKDGEVRGVGDPHATGPHHPSWE